MSDSFKDFILDQLDGLPEFESKRMFGGTALLVNGSAFGKIKHNKFWLKVDDTNHNDFQTLGMQQYTYGKDGSRTLNFYEVPVDVIENGEELIKWTQKSMDIAIG